MTVTCARCHDHMFDPIPTKDYYALHGIFASTLEPAEKPVISAPTQSQLTDNYQKRSFLEQENREIYYRVFGNHQQDFFSKVGSYLLAAKAGGRPKGLSAEEIQERQTVMNTARLDREMMQLFIRRTRRDDPVFGPFRWFAELQPAEFAEKAPAILAEIASGRDRRRDWNPLVVAAFAGTKPASLQEVTGIYQQLFSRLEPRRSAYLVASSQALQGIPPGFEPAEIQILQTPFEILPASRATTDGLRAFISRMPNQIVNRSPLIFAKLNELEMTHPGTPARAMLVTDAAIPRNSRVFVRGQQETKGDVVPRRFLEVLSPNQQPLPFTQGSGRLELAQSIASKANPLTARVMVNRVWMHHFGEGFVRTPDDLGTQSEVPSHPELLDYLSSYFVEQGWSMKRLHKLIMLSHVYQESSHTVPQFEQLDPENRLLWRANIRRLDFEATRDSLLVFSGKLDRTVGGKPVNLTEEPYSYRRSVYGYIDRGNLPELMSNFDFSDPDMPNSKRTTTIVPQQALFLMNSAMSIDVARRIVARPEVGGTADPLARLLAIYRIIFQRAPKPGEIQMAYQFIGLEAKTMPAVPETAVQMPAQQNRERLRLANRQRNRRAAVAPISNQGELVERKALTPWETYAQALLLSNEAAYVN